METKNDDSSKSGGWTTLIDERICENEVYMSLKMIRQFYEFVNRTNVKEAYHEYANNGNGEVNASFN